jgi:hypothetical protein
MAEPGVTLDLARVRPEAREIVARAARVYVAHTRQWFVGLLLHGSAFKGGSILGCSDVDFQLYLRDDAFTGDGELPLALTLALHRDLARVDPAPFNYLQCFAHGSRLPAGQVGPIPGAYTMLAGRLPVPEATAEQILSSARTALDGLRVPPAKLTASLLDHGEGRLERHVRLLCTDIWPTLFHVLALQDGEPIRIWGLPKPEAIALLPAGTPTGDAIRAFYDALRVYYPAHTDAEAGLRVIEQGATFLRTVQVWWRAVGE